MSMKRYYLAILLILTFFVSGVYADVHVGVSGGSGSGSQGAVGLGIGASRDATIAGSITSNGASILPTISISGIGDLNENHQVTDSAQNHAEIHAKVVKGLNIQYSDTLTPGEGNLGSTTGSVQADQSLTVGDSKFIKCSQSASNSEGDKASAGIEIDHGSLTNYQGHAIAGLSSVNAYQSFDAASGIEIGIYSTATNAQKDKAKSWIDVDGAKNKLGNITNFADQASASAAEANASQTFSKAIGNCIGLGASSSNNEINKSDVSLKIAKGYVTNFTALAVASAIGTSANQTFDKATGNKIELGASSSNKGINKSGASLEIEKGSVTNYTSRTAGSVTETNASQSFSNATGNKIEVDAFSSNKEKDRADTSLEIQKGSVTNFTGNTSTSATDAKASQTLDNATGNKIGIWASSSNKGINKSDVSLKIEKGYVTNFTGLTSASATETNASQTFDNATGKRVELSASSSNKEKDGADVRLDIEKGFVSNFTSQTSASAAEANANQTFSNATGYEVELSASSSNKGKDKADVDLEIEKGYVTNFTGQATASAAEANASQTFSNATGNKIGIWASSSNKGINKSEVSLKIVKGFVTNFTDQALSSATETNASQSFDNATGHRVELGASSSNKEKDRADVSLKVEKGFVSNFTSLTSASAAEANASQTFSNATGNKVELGASSSNKEKDRADASLEIEKGFVTNFTSEARSTASNVSARLVNSSPGSLVSGKKIVFVARASDASGDKVSAITKVKNGTLSGAANIALVDTSTKYLNASQSASALTGTSLEADRKASNAAGVTVHKTTNVANPSISNYQNSASVIAGTPSVVPP